jgi:hypothetical protein
MAKYDPELIAHKTWLGLLQPVGLVVSPPALVRAQAVPSRNVVELQQTLLAVVRHDPDAGNGNGEPFIAGFPRFAEQVLGWQPEDLAGAAGGPELDDSLEVVLPDYGETLRPTYAVLDTMGDGRVLMLVKEVPVGTPLDQAIDQGKSRGWQASPEARLERLLRELEVPAGLLCNGQQLRLVYAPRGESAGHLTFPVAAMCEVGGRPILAALEMLLGEHRVFSAPDGQRLLDILAHSRRYQAEVSNALSQQVLGALWELLRGFQAADEAAGHRLIDGLAREQPEQIYGGLLTVLLRLVFLLYAEDSGLMPDDEVYTSYYSVTGLYERLRIDAGRYPDTMDQRFGAWAALLSLFRMVFDGGGFGCDANGKDAEGDGGFHLPTRHGQLFNPDEYPFLEGRPPGASRMKEERLEVPRVSDGCLYRVLDALLILDVDGDGIGDRLSYRALDVEQIGSVYEAMMGFEIMRAFGRALALRPKDIVISVDELLELDGGKRQKWLKDQAECELTGKATTALKQAATPDDVVAALGRKVSPRTPRLVPPGGLFLQPGEERRRSGSHYTPRELTEPIVRTTLRPVLEALGERPAPEQILELKVCDPAMGSGAFLVEACRQLAERLVTAWEVHDAMPELPPDEEALLHARRLVAQRCLYGVDKNPFAVNLAKLSLWLVTLARDHAFTFLDHALKCGDSLVGLTKAQIGAFDWKPQKDEPGPLFDGISQEVDEAAGWRDKLQSLDEGDYIHKKEAWWEAESALHDARLVGDLCIAAFFGAEKTKAREELRRKYRNMVDEWKAGERDVGELRGIVEELREGEKPVPPFHWEIEFPEVFGRETPGFDAMVGNPPFMGGSKLSSTLNRYYPEYFKVTVSESKGKSDLVAYFLRRSFDLLRMRGTFSLVTTNTISEGDTRYTGLQWIRNHEGWIYEARKRVGWPGQAAVIVSVVSVIKDSRPAFTRLDGKIVPVISAFLFTNSIDENPKTLSSNREIAFSGSNINGAGFVLSNEEFNRLIREDETCGKWIRPYIGGEEINQVPDLQPVRYVIDFCDQPFSVVSIHSGLRSHLENKVYHARQRSKEKRLREKWWLHSRPARRLVEKSSCLPRLLASPRLSNHFGLVFLNRDMVFTDMLTLFCFDSYSAFTMLQSRMHEVWSRLLGSSFKDDLRYVPESCFETFPFPKNWQSNPTLEAAGKTYY